MTPISLAVLIAPLVGIAMLSGCAQPQPEGPAAPPSSVPVDAAPPPSNADVFRFRIGALHAVALKDGDLEVPNDGKTFGVGQSPDDVAKLLAAAGQPTDVLHLSIQPLLVRDDTRILLFDTGAADAAFARAGRLPASLRAAGVEPAEVTDVFISHRHADHVAGLLTPDGELAFPGATIHISAPEWKAMQAEDASAGLVTAITAKVTSFQPGAELVPGVVTALVDDGHTPGHSAFEIASGNERLLYIGDTAHHFAVSVQQPEWTIAYDENPALAETRRRELLQRAAADNTRIYAVHFPFPGLGHVVKQNDSLLWVPER